MSEQEINSGGVSPESGAKPVTISERIGKDIIAAMKAKDEHTLTTLRMVKSALKSKEIDKREPLTDAEEAQILTTLHQAAARVSGVVYQGRAARAGGEGEAGDRHDRGLPAAGRGRRRGARRGAGRASPTLPRATAARSRGRRTWVPRCGWCSSVSSRAACGPTARWSAKW